MGTPRKSTTGRKLKSVASSRHAWAKGSGESRRSRGRVSRSAVLSNWSSGESPDFACACYPTPEGGGPATIGGARRGRNPSSLRAHSIRGKSISVGGRLQHSAIPPIFHACGCPELGSWASVVMKAREKDRKFFDRNVVPNILARM